MAQLPASFNTADHKDMNDFTPLPSDDYVAQIVKSEMKQNKKKNGQFLELTFDVLQGDHKGQKFWERLNLVNPSPQAVEIAQKVLATIGRAVNKGQNLNIEDSQILHGKPLMCSVKFNPATSTNPATNDVTMYKQLGAKPAATGDSKGVPDVNRSGTLASGSSQSSPQFDGDEKDDTVEDTVETALETSAAIADSQDDPELQQKTTDPIYDS